MSLLEKGVKWVEQVEGTWFFHQKSGEFSVAARPATEEEIAEHLAKIDSEVAGDESRLSALEAQVKALTDENDALKEAIAKLTVDAPEETVTEEGN